jgi:hypothetical protein
MNRKKTFLMLLTLFVSLMATGAGFAQDGNLRTPVARKRQVHQQRRIVRGVRSGELTKKEVKVLRDDQQDVREEKREARADGIVTAGERKEIQQEQNQASRRIHRAKHNRRDRK